MNNAGFSGLYIHVPFCKTKCPYCDFYSLTDFCLVPAWLEALRREAWIYRGRFEAFDSLYLGGGTPSVLSERELDAVFKGVRECFHLESGAEITLEANPDDMTRDKLSLYADLGINRISLGVQSLHERELVFLRRRHTARQAMEAMERIRASAIPHMSVDLIYGFDPGQGDTDSLQTRWTATLDRVLQFQPEHLSCYQMTYEEGTPFGLLKTNGMISPLGEDLESELFLLTSQILEAQGYCHYEISNFSRGPHNTSRHNCKYWCHAPYLGLGPAAHSFQDGVRWWNGRSVEDYCRRLQEGKSPVEESETLTGEQTTLEELYLGLRTQQGVNWETLPEHVKRGSVLRDLERSGVLNIQNGRIQATTKGFLVADSLPLLLGG